MTREELRVAVKDALKKNNNVAIQAATGTGKTRVSIDILNAIGNNIRVLVLVAERAHIDNWIVEFNKWNYSTDLVDIVCYASMKKMVNNRYEAIIFDEAHHLGSELRLELFPALQSTYKIFLSATLKDSLIYGLEQSCGHIESIKMGLQEAISSNVLPEPKIILVPMTLDNKVENQTIEEEWGKADKRVTLRCHYKDRWKYLRAKKQYPNAKLIIYCTEAQKYNYISEQFEYYKQRYFSCRNDAIKNKWLQCGSKRKRLLGLLKTEKAKEILKKIKDKRFICFCTSIEQAEYLGGDNAIHSKKKNCSEILNSFNNLNTSSLFAVGMLQEGVNLTNIEVGVIIQLDGEERAFIQKFGRCLRADSPIQYILYYKGTRDEEYLNNALEGIDKKYITEYEYFNK